MATKSVNITVDAAIRAVADAQGDAIGGSQTASTSVALIDYTTVAANIATLVADGATPTQGHVNTLDTNWSALKTLIDTAVADAAAAGVAAPTTADVVVSVKTTLTPNKLRAALDKAYDYLVKSASIITG